MTTERSLAAVAEELAAEVGEQNRRLKRFSEQLKAEKENNRRTRRLSRTVAVLAAGIGVVGGLGLWDDHQDDRAEARREAAEAQRRCESALQARAEDDAKWIEILTDIGRPQILEIYRRHADDRPPPASCVEAQEKENR